MEGVKVKIGKILIEKVPLLRLKVPVRIRVEDFRVDSRPFTLLAEDDVCEVIPGLTWLTEHGVRWSTLALPSAYGTTPVVCILPAQAAAGLSSRC